MAVIGSMMMIANPITRPSIAPLALDDVDVTERRLQSGSELERIVLRPEMHEVEARLLTEHVVVHGCNLDTVLAQRLHYRRDFLVGQNEITGDRRLAASERLKIDGVRQSPCSPAPPYPLPRLARRARYRIDRCRRYSCLWRQVCGR